jgi:holliday junction DNA helicase RuvA
MIGRITGTVHSQGPQRLLIDVGGVSFIVFVTKNTASRIHEGDQAELWTHLISKENILDLYGFEESRELEFFELLLTISGIGPKSALSIIDIATVEVLKQAVLSEDISYLTQISGIGKKSAQKIVLELKDKVIGTAEESALALGQESLDALEALVALGFSRKPAQEALRALPKEVTDTADKISGALKLLNN